MKDLLKVWHLEIMRILSNKGFLFLVVAWPIVYAVFFGRVYSDQVVTEMPVAVVDMDKTQLSRTLTRFVGTNRSFRIAETFENPELLKDDFLKGKFAAALIIPRDLQRDVKRGHRAQVTLWINATNVVVANLTISEMSYIVGTVSGGVQLKFFQKTGSSSTRALEAIQPLPVEIAKLHNPGLNYLSYLTPGIWAAILHQVLILLGALCFVPHQQRQEQNQLLDKVKHPLSIFWGKWLLYFAVGLGTFEIFFRILFPIFNIPIHAPIIALLVFSSLLCASALSLGCLISTVSQRTIGALKGVLLLASPAFILSGYTFPLSQMPEVYRYISAIFPLTPFVSGYKKIYLEGLSLSYLSSEILHLVLLTLTYTLIALWFFHKKWKRDLI